MIRLRRTIEGGVRHRWLGPLFVILLCLLLAMLFLHAMHDGQCAGTELGELCLAISVLLGAVLLVRIRACAPRAAALVRLGRAPPAFRRVSLPVRLAVVASPPPLRL